MLGEGAGVVAVTIRPQRGWHGSTVGTSPSMFIASTVSYVSNIVSRLALSRALFFDRPRAKRYWKGLLEIVHMEIAFRGLCTDFSTAKNIFVSKET